MGVTSVLQCGLHQMCLNIYIKHVNDKDQREQTANIYFTVHKSEIGFKDSQIRLQKTVSVSF